jgi:hypothetical protein
MSLQVFATKEKCCGAELKRGKYKIYECFQNDYLLGIKTKK